MTVSSPRATRNRRGVQLPVLMKEMRTRMRGRRTPVLLFTTTALTIFVGLLIISTQWDDISTTSTHIVRSMAVIGRALFIGLIILEGVLCCLITPALTAGAIALEHEQQTLEFLILTRLSSANILLGKLISALSFVFIIVICALPVAAISFLLGGVDPALFFWSLLLILSLIIFFGAIGMLCSVQFRKTATAVVAAFALCFVWILGVPLLTGFSIAIMDGSSSDYTSLFLILAVLLAGIEALLPTMMFYLLLSAIFRRRIHRLVTFLFWGASTVTLSWLFVSNVKVMLRMINSEPEYLFLGNPVMSMFFLIMGEEIHSRSSTPPSWVIQHQAPLTVGLLILYSAVVLLLAIKNMQRLRENIAS